MKPEAIKQMQGYEEVQKEIAVSRKFGDDFSGEKGRVAQIIGRLHPARVPLRVTKVKQETPTTKTLRLVGDGVALPPFLAGQYIALTVTAGTIRTCRAYSISSSPLQRAYWEVTVRRVEGGLVSNYLLDQVKPGDKLESSGPTGAFVFNPIIHGPAMVCIAGGSGITPFMSMVREIADAGLGRDVFLFCGNRTREEAIFHQELTEISENNPNIRYVPVIEDPEPGFGGECGLMNREIFQKVLGDFEDKTFFLCGPRGMYDFCLPELRESGVPGRKIRKEMYGPPVEIWKEKGWPQGVGPDATFQVKVSGGQTLEARAGDPLLTSLEKAGVLVPSVCRSGECSYCRVKVVSGTVFEPSCAKVRKSDRQFGWVHSCTAYPLEDLEIHI